MEDVLDWCQDIFDDRLLNLMFRVLMLVFGVGAVVYVLNMLGMSGYEWADAGTMARAFDIVFFALFALVASAIALKNPWAVPLWLLTAVLQVGLFTAYSDAFAGATSRLTDPSAMVQTHALFLSAFAVLLLVRRFR